MPNIFSINVYFENTFEKKEKGKKGKIPGQNATGNKNVSWVANHRCFRWMCKQSGNKKKETIYNPA